MILSMLLNLWMILLDGAEAKDKGFKTIYAFKQLSAKSWFSLMCSVLFLLLGFTLLEYTVLGGGGKCNFYKVFMELKSTLLGYAAVKLLCLAFHLMLLEIFSSACQKTVCNCWEVWETCILGPASQPQFSSEDFLPDNFSSGNQQQH